MGCAQGPGWDGRGGGGRGVYKQVVVGVLRAGEVSVSLQAQPV